ncbi:OCIA domain-containing protein 1-like isoform X2 [Oscarella lobularis]|uniref:OCIA domain-containing protein 1-like isoform X2 n=1 Tax=Oscarella lobularis TaxID=121494 RepID=UPI0033133750
MAEAKTKTPDAAKTERPCSSGNFRPKLSDQEIAVLKDCRRNSVWYRGVPLGTASAVSLYLVTTRGFLGKGAQKWPKLISSLAFFVGFGLGARSYRSTCFENIKKLENSFLADMVKAGEAKGGFGPFFRSNEFEKIMKKHNVPTGEAEKKA